MPQRLIFYFSMLFMGNMTKLHGEGTKKVDIKKQKSSITGTVGFLFNRIACFLAAPA